MRILEYAIEEKDAGRTVKSVALRELHLSRSMFSSLKFGGGITVDGRKAYADDRLQKGDVLTVCLTDEAQPMQGYPMSLEIVYRDQDYMVINKPAPLPTLSSVHKSGPTLENVLYAHLGEPADYVFRPVNRLDKGTSGLLAVACNAHAQQLLQKQLHTESFVREYRAICPGIPPDKEGTIDLPIGRMGSGARRAIMEDGLRAVTHYRVEKTGKNRTLLRLRLETGRTHQIRVHLAAVGCPILGDYLYGTPDPALPGRFALHACRISFIHPFTGERIDAEAPLPPELEALFH